MPTGKRPTTLRDIAKRAGVSVPTASRALHEYGRVSDDTRERVRAVAKTLGYRPNQVARSMITGRSQSIGVVCADLSSPFFAEARRALSDVAKQRGFSILIVNTDENLQAEREAILLLQEKRVDGVIVAPANVHEVEHLADMQRAVRPVVLLDRSSGALDADSVTVDDVAAMAAATIGLLRDGHRRVGIVTELRTAREADWSGLLDSDRPRGELNPSSRRLMGYLRAHQECGIPVDPALVARTGATDVESARVAARRMLMAAKPTAIITVDNATSVGTFGAVKELNLRVPEDVSFVAFDNLDWTSLVTPPLTVIEQPVTTIGRIAAQALLDRLEGWRSGPGEEILLDTRLISRQSLTRR